MQPVYQETYTGPRWTYGLRFRPAFYATVPEGRILGSERPDSRFTYGVVDYPRQLTEAEVYGFQLVDLAAEARAIIVLDEDDHYVCDAPSLEQFLADNEVDPAEGARIMYDLKIHGEASFGGGAAPNFKIRRAADFKA